MVNAVFFSNTAQATTLSGSISAGATSITVVATTGFPTNFPYVLAVDFQGAAEELVSVTSAAGLTLTVTRGYGGTSAQSHSLGAVVRHVYDATEATAFRTHEDSAAAHGATGAVVGTTNTQTLTNKTLTNPTVTNPTITGGGSLAGTFSGTPTFSGNVSNTGEIILSNLLRGSRATAADSAFETRVTNDSVARWFVRAGGDMFWGPGTGPVDTNLYRSTANVLKTDDAFEAANFPAGAWTSYTPTWTTATGSNTPSYGNAALDCAFTKIGRTVLFRVDIVFGSTTNFGAAPTLSDNWRFSLPVTAASTIQEGGWAELNQSTALRVVARLRFTTTGAFELEVSSGKPDGADIPNKGLADSLSPWTWTSGDAVRATGMYEAST